MIQEKTLTGYPSIDKPWLKYYSEEAINAVPPKCSIYENIYEANREYLEETALLYYGKKVTYKKLFHEVDKAAKAFVSCGVNYGDNVAICMPATPETIYTILALNKIGANANMLNPTFSEEQLRDRINDTEAKVLVVVNELFWRVKNVLSKTKIETVVSCSAVNSLGAVIKAIKKVKKIPNTMVWNEFVKKEKDVTLTIPGYKPNHPAVMVYSSGTTGASKGIQLTNDSINATINEGKYIGFEWKRQDRYIAVVPIWFSTGICATVLVPLRHGITVILEPTYDFKVFYEHIVKYRPNFTITASGLPNYLASEKELEEAYKSFKYFVVGGEYVTPHVEKRLNQWLEKNGSPEKLHKGYGMCECGGTVTATHYKCNVVGSAGIPTPHVTVAAFDLTTGKELKYGERGEVRVLSPCRMLGYYGKPEATEEYFHTDEKGQVWACTGDMGYVTEDGCLFVDGRLSSSYRNEDGGVIYLFDIERAVLDHEQVRQCKTVVSEVDGKCVHVAHVVLMPGADEEKVLQEVKKHCFEKLPKNHMPSLVKLYEDALPVSKSGKLDVLAMESDVTDLVKL
ncbi:MAG: acyl--CoA ligase [Lachnospiraceae bacterium]|nr:acyl--CoA ligase [Lachnospiraceae bacterium]